MHILERDITLNVGREKLWAFMSTPANLNELTPADLQFQIVSSLPETMHEGLMIQYRIKIPMLGWQNWVTEITHIREGEYFVDEQRLGPYRLWHHQHRLEAISADQTRMVDRVSYLLPFWFAGELVHALWVEKMLDDIFSYRAKRLGEIFA
ncbi:MAG: hypothetical protein C0618_10475 [Desulfuromonas sp.]|nr:MAG: hypothetical protein C0618_10475 [Desulfuromonas sp.]